MLKVTKELRRNMEEKKIDVDLTARILDNYNAGKYDNVEPVQVTDIPQIDNETILDMTRPLSCRLDWNKARERIAGLLPGLDLSAFGRREGQELVADNDDLHALGMRLLPRVSYGILNGGSATSYADTKKNSSFSEQLFALLRPEFERMAELVTGKSKGVAPAFIQPDGSPGPSFLELKMRSLLIQALHYYRLSDTDVEEDLPAPVFPMFQMTSVYNDDEIARAYDAYRESPMLRDLIEAADLDITRVETGVQPMIAAYTHSGEGRPKAIFDRAYGKPGETLPLPGGHGQNFQMLRDVYRRLYENGKRFVYLGNVDNLGFTVSPAAVAYLALTGKQAGFDFAFRTPVDVKGGILVVDQRKRLNAADLGPAVSKEDAFQAEREGKDILFNCATGLFDLEYLVNSLDHIVENLPVRFSDQDKDAGKYSQAEQITWEIIGMLDDFLIFGIDKYDRFLAAKLLSETLMTSGLKLDDPGYPGSSDPQSDLRGVAKKLHGGLTAKLESVYGMYYRDGRWEPRAPEEL